MYVKKKERVKNITNIYGSETQTDMLIVRVYLIFCDTI